MNPLDIITTALRSISSSKLRSGLTLLGIIIGITAVTVLMSIGRGVQQSITSSIQSQGTNLLFVQPGFSERSGEDSSTLTLGDAEALMDPLFAPSVKAVAPQINTFAQIVAGREYISAQVIGITPDYAEVRNTKVAQGSFITPAHIDAKAEVAVISASVSNALFGTNYSSDAGFGTASYGTGGAASAIPKTQSASAYASTDGSSPSWAGWKIQARHSSASATRFSSQSPPPTTACRPAEPRRAKSASIP